MAALEVTPLTLGNSKNNVFDYTRNLAKAVKKIKLTANKNVSVSLTDTNLFTKKPEKCLISYVGEGNVIVGKTPITAFPSTDTWVDATMEDCNPVAIWLLGMDELNFFSDTDIIIFVSFYLNT